MDSLVHDEDALKLLLKKFGPDNIMLGSDYPFPLGELSPGALIESVSFSENKDKDASIKTKMLSDNALKFLGYERSFFE